MNSTWMLIKVLRMRILIGVALCFIVQFLLVYDMKAPSIEKVIEVQAITLAFAMIFAILIRYHGVLFGLPFPVTNRQLAWIPTFCLGILWAAGHTGTFMGVILLGITGIDSNGLSEWGKEFPINLTIFPIMFLLFTLLDRLLRLVGAQAFFFTVLIIPGISFGDNQEVLENVLTLYQYLWPLCIVLGVFFIVGAPSDIASMDHPVLMKQGLMSSFIRTPGSPYRTPVIKTLGDIFTIILCLLFASGLIYKLFEILTLWNILGGIAKVYLLGIVVGIFLGVRRAWHGARASGFSFGKSVILFLFQCSVVLLPLAWALGLKRGAIAKCDNCRDFKFLWANRCPRCGHANAGRVVGFWPTMPWKKDHIPSATGQKQMRGRGLYRMIMPIYLVMLGFIMYKAEFQYDRFSFDLPDEGASVSQTTVGKIKDYLESVEDVRSWLNADEEVRLLMPERFRIVVVESEGGLEITCYWLGWEGDGPMGERIRDRIQERFSDVPLTIGHERWGRDYGYVDEGVNPVTLPGYLDDGIHWVER